MVLTVTLGSGRHRANTRVVVVAGLHSCSHLEATREIPGGRRQVAIALSELIGLMD